MPIYQFKCPECGHEAEELMKHDDATLECTLCTARVRWTSKKWSTKKVVMDKVFPTGTSFELKGTGWYKDGYTKTKKASETKTSETKTSES